MKLAATALTPVAPTHRVVVMHGLLGSRRNWRSLQNALAQRLSSVSVEAIDLRNHGETRPHVPTMTFEEMAGDVAHYLDTQGPPDVPTVLVGHSMGGKVAMHLALTQPQRVAALVVVDIAPVKCGAQAKEDARADVPLRYPVATGEHDHLFGAMKRLPLPCTLKEAKSYLGGEEGIEPRVVDFLLTNLDLTAGQWMVPLDTLHDFLPTLRAFPRTDAVYAGPTLFIGGGDSEYILDAHAQTMARLFPASTTRKIAHAGHWVHAEKPHEFLALLGAFMADVMRHH